MSHKQSRVIVSKFFISLELAAEASGKMEIKSDENAGIYVSILLDLNIVQRLLRLSLSSLTSINQEN
jgi:hypothetical protein